MENSVIDEKKAKLIIALKKEKDLFSKRNQDTFEHDITISYLETGKTNEDPEKFELLYATMYDYECVCRDYAE